MSVATHSPPAAPENLSKLTTSYRVVWRWHFYAGVFCLPFIVILCLSGAIYLFKPQIDAYLDRPLDNLTLAGEPKPLDEQVAAAMTAVTGARLKALELRSDPADAARVHVTTADGIEQRVLVRPDTLAIIGVENQKSRLTALMHDIHGELLLGTPGAIAVELAGAWAIVMLVTGLYLWWPRSSGLGGVLYPRLDGGSRRFLRDLHAVTGLWLSLLALFFLISALPWTTVWGSSLKYVRSQGQPAQIRQDWTTGPASARQQRIDAFKNAPPAPVEDEHAEHRGHAGHENHAGHKASYTGFDEIAALALPLHLPSPVFISPPSTTKPNWIVRSDTQNRPERRTLEFSAGGFEQVRDERFSDKPLLDRIIGVGVAAHEGQLFGWPNQLLGLLTAIGYLIIVVTAAIMWLRRRPRGALGAPPAPSPRPGLAPFVVALIVVLGLFLPTLGISLLFVVATEALLVRLLPDAAKRLVLASLRSAPGQEP
jgi:uncharacterized iron-regulated membrane protein